MLKRKYSNKPDYKRTSKYIAKTEYINSPNFKGYVTLFKFEEVLEPLITEYKNKQYCIADSGYIWLQTLPEGEQYCLTTLIDHNHQIIEWYFDIIKAQGVTDDQIPYFDDIYLDVILPLDGNVYLIDEDELQEALDNNVITLEDYNKAYQVADYVMNEIAIKEKLQEFSQFYLNYMLNLINNP